MPCIYVYDSLMYLKITDKIDSMIFSSNSNVNGAIFAVFAALSLSISMTFAKQLHPDIPTSFVVLIRSCFGFIFFIPFFLKNRKSFRKSEKLPLHILRIILTAGAMICTYFAYRNLPIAFATSIGMTSPLFIAILSIIILREEITRQKWLLILLGYIGVIFVIRPSIHTIDLATLSALSANMLAACCVILIKILSRHDSTVTIMLYTNVGITVMSFIISMTNTWQMIALRDVVILSLTGLLGVVTQYCSINALKSATPSFIAPFEYTRIFFATLIGIFIFQEIPSIYVMIGSGIIIFSTYMMTRLEGRK